MHSGMKTSMKRVFWMLSVLFILVLGTMFKLVAYERQTIASNSYNARLGYGNEDFKRGSIYDSCGNVMAESVKGSEGYIRKYPYGEKAAHITGYTGAGAAGIEAVENFTLLGLDNEISQRVKNIFDGNELTGNDVHLTIDMDIQKLAFDLLGKNKGAAVVMDPTTGGIIAMASTPSFNPNTVRDDWNELSTNKESPMLNRATQGLYPPGSTFKIVTALTAMRNINNIDDYLFECNGEIKLEDKIIHCFNNKSHGVMTIDDAMAHSCNTTFSDLGVKEGASKLRETADSLKFNSKLSFDLPISDTIVSLSKFSSTSELAETSIGQGKTLVTPLFMAMLISSIANDGVMMQPYMVDKITDMSGKVKNTTVPEIYGNVMTAEEANRLTTMLEKVINKGTGTAAKLNGYQAAGKTGTAENSKEYDHSWFVGFASTDNPKVAVAVILENVNGSARATPIGGKLMQAVLDKLNGKKIDNGNYNYTPPVEDDNGDDINTNIVEDVVAPEDDFVLGSDELNPDDNVIDTQIQQEQTDTLVPPDEITEPEINTDIVENHENGNVEDLNGNGQSTVPEIYYDEYGNHLEVVNK